eukprot:TRINITY_DN6950_c0_g1_i1.p1 TRINITY_DN6950_c0_g1~~TRINITY_DN6950_c0_g1_i1.p1  ORF type:complete len:231 (-),score=50.39 TRINITY_DN6950_c0_g1_i1:237-929(-)
MIRAHRAPKVFFVTAAVVMFCASHTMRALNFVPSATSTLQQSGQRMRRRSTSTIQPQSNEVEAQLLSLSKMKAETLGEQLYHQEMVRAQHIDEQFQSVVRRLEGLDGRSAASQVALQHDACIVEWSDSMGDAAIQEARRCNDIAEGELMKLEKELEKLLLGSAASDREGGGRLPIYTFGSIVITLCFLAFHDGMNAPVDQLPGHFASTVNYAAMSDDEVAGLSAAFASVV